MSNQKISVEEKISKKSILETIQMLEDTLSQSEKEWNERGEEGLVVEALKVARLVGLMQSRLFTVKTSLESLPIVTR